MASAISTPAMRFGEFIVQFLHQVNSEYRRKCLPNIKEAAKSLLAISSHELYCLSENKSVVLAPVSLATTTKLCGVQE